MYAYFYIQPCKVLRDLETSWGHELGFVYERLGPDDEEALDWRTG